MSETLNHPPPERLEAFVEESLGEGDRSAVGVHLATCERCRTEVVELRSLFEALATLPELSPRTGFADRVMRKVHMPRPWLVWVNAWVDRVTPATNRGWALAAGMLAVPVLALTGMAWWLLSQPEVTPERLWLVATAMTGEALGTGWQWLLGAFARSTLAAWLGGLVELAESLGRGGLGLAAVMFATMTAASIYVLYENLFRTSGRRTEHASYLF